MPGKNESAQVSFRFLGTGPKREGISDRFAASLQVVTPNGAVLVDCPPSARSLARFFAVDELKAVVLTHAHHDSTDGLVEFAEQLRMQSIPLYATPDVFARLRNRMKSIEPYLENAIDIGESFELAGLHWTAGEVEHSQQKEFTTVGFKIETEDASFVYAPDCAGLPNETFELFEGADVVVLDGSMMEQKISGHLRIPEAVELGKTLNTPKLVLTQIGESTPHRVLQEQVTTLWSGAHVAHDLQTIVIDGALVEGETVEHSADLAPSAAPRAPESTGHLHQGSNFMNIITESDFQALEEGRLTDRLKAILEDIPDVEGYLFIDNVKITNDEAWAAIKSGELTGFSWAGMPVKQTIVSKDPVYLAIYHEIDPLRDISVVHRPQESSAQIEIVSEEEQTIRGMVSFPNFSGRHILVMPSAFTSAMDKYMNESPKGTLFLDHDIERPVGSIGSFTIEESSDSNDTREALELLQEARNLLETSEGGDLSKEETLQESGVTDLLTSTEIDLVEAEIDEHEGVIRNVCVLTSRSQNGRRYLPSAFKSLLPMLDGAKSYFNHPTTSEISERRGTRDVRDYFGVHRKPRISGNKVFTDFEPAPEHRAFAFAIAKQRPKGVGFSINAAGRVRVNSGQAEVENFTVLRSVDLVADAGTTQNLFESIQGDTDVNFQELTLETLREERSDLVEQIQTSAAEAAKDEMQAEVEQLTEQNDDLKKQVATLRRAQLISSVVDELKIDSEKITESHIRAIGGLDEYQAERDGETVTVTVREQIVDLLSPLATKKQTSNVVNSGNESNPDETLNESDETGGKQKSKAPTLDEEFERFTSKGDGNSHRPIMRAHL